jgi:hypothetical protein
MAGVEAAGRGKWGEISSYFGGNPHSLADNAGPRHFRHQSAPPLALLWVGSGLGVLATEMPSVGPKTTLGRPTTTKKMAGTPMCRVAGSIVGCDYF